MTRTLLKKLNIRRFRALTDLEIEPGTHVTLICGKNGTSKSSILGIAAQIFSFETDYEKNEALDFKTIAGANFKSPFSDHFRFSQKFDRPGTMEVGVDIHDGYTGADATAELGLYSRVVRGKLYARPVVRKNSTAVDQNDSRNFTHPVIFLSLKRLMPIAARDYRVRNFDYLEGHNEKFLALNNELLNKTSSLATGTDGSVASAVAHSSEYDQQSVSAGEDNVGQIILALMSFRKLKEEYADYKGGLLLIDEADAALFPAAQLKLLEVLDRECQELQLQVIMTSHSPTMVERVFELSQQFRRKYKTYYLSDTFGQVKALENASWPKIYADLHTTTVPLTDGSKLPSVNVYFEDAEAHDFFSALMFRQPSKKLINPLREVSLGCDNYLHLVRKKVPEFSMMSLIVLDGDVGQAASGHSSVVLLPGALPPDQLIFEFLFNLSAADQIWQNNLGFTRPVFTNRASPIISKLGIQAGHIQLSQLIQNFQATGAQHEAGKKLRELFKDFYKQADFQRFLRLSGSQNPWKRWLAENVSETQDFRERFSKALTKRMVEGYGIDPAKLATL